MRLVAALLAFEVACAASVAILIIIVLARKALVSRPCLDQRAVHAEVLAREQALLLGNRHHFVEEFDDRIVPDQTFTVRLTHDLVEDLLIHRRVGEGGLRFRGAGRRAWAAILPLPATLPARLSAPSRARRRPADALWRTPRRPTGPSGPCRVSAAHTS